MINRRVITTLLIVTGLLLLLLSFGPLLYSEAWYYLKELKHQDYKINDKNGVQDSVFARFLSLKPVNMKPINTQFALVIEKIGVNAPVVADVPVDNPEAYKEALKRGVAHASVSDYPSADPGNTYIFAHSSLNFWELGSYATVFNLLHKLSYGDRIHVFYHNQVYIYEVANKEVVRGWEVKALTRPVIEPLLTLQTCDPPGTTLNRLIITARLLKVEDL